MSLISHISWLISTSATWIGYNNGFLTNTNAHISFLMGRFGLKYHHMMPLWSKLGKIRMRCMIQKNHPREFMEKLVAFVCRVIALKSCVKYLYFFFGTKVPLLPKHITCPNTYTFILSYILILSCVFFCIMIFICCVLLILCMCFVDSFPILYLQPNTLVY